MPRPRAVACIDTAALSPTRERRVASALRGPLASGAVWHGQRCRRVGLFGPNGAAECSHGWSDAAFGVAQPVERSCFNILRPDGAAELP
jgi:hypothetical protein